MTSEVLLMNLEGVALGADSAITLSSPNRASISQPGVDKIYVINQAAPVAAMYYNVASFAGLPWRTVLSEFSASLGGDVLSMADYRRRLVAFLADLESYPALPVDKQDEMDIFRTYCVGFLMDFLEWLEFAGWDPDEAVTEDMAAGALELYREAIFIDTPAHIDEDGAEIAARLRPATGLGDKRLAEFLATNLGPTFNELLGPALKDELFPESQVAPLMQLATESIGIEWLPDAADDATTGIVLAGFGAGQAVPQAISLRVLGAFGGVLKYQVLKTYAPDPNNEPVVIETFAQANLTQAMLNGAMPRFTHDASHVAAGLLNTAFAQAVRHTAHTNKKLAKELHNFLRPLRRFVPELALETAKDLRRRRVHARLNPLLDAANTRLLGDYAYKFMMLPVTESELMRNDTVGKPVHVVMMARGECHRTIDGVPQ